MCTKYQDFLDKLKEERISRKWTQLQMGQKLRMTQSHYSKAEMGSRRFTYYEMKCLCETDLDIYYIFTGYRCRTEYREFFKTCTYEELKCYLGMLGPVVEHLYRNRALDIKWDVYKKIHQFTTIINSAPFAEQGILRLS